MPIVCSLLQYITKLYKDFMCELSLPNAQQIKKHKLIITLTHHVTSHQVTPSLINLVKCSVKNHQQRPSALHKDSVGLIIFINHFYQH